MKDVLDRFSPATREWFNGTFAAPTAAQEQGWAAIAQREHTLILAPTGSGKTLAAFLFCLDKLASEPKPAEPKRRCRVLYVSPMKALAHDVERTAPIFRRPGDARVSRVEHCALPRAMLLETVARSGGGEIALDIRVQPRAKLLAE